MALRLRIQAEGAVEWVEFESDAPVRVGAAPPCELILSPAHTRVPAEPCWLRLEVRRGAVVAVAPASRWVSACGHPVEAPVVLDMGASISVGAVELRIEATRFDELGPVGATVGGLIVEREMPPTGPGTRRFACSAGLEMTLADRPGAPWRDRVPLTPSAHAAQPWLWSSWGGRPALFEKVEDGLRLRRLIDLEDQGLRLPPSARGLILAHVARALEERPDSAGPHGGVRAEAIQVSFEGRARLLAAGPDVSGLEAGLSIGQGRASSDRGALLELAVHQLGLTRDSPLLPVFAKWAGSDAPLGPLPVIQAAGGGWDPSPSSLARCVAIASAFSPPRILALSGSSDGQRVLPPSR